MTEFDQREKAFESKFAHDNELKFKIDCRTAYLFGLWAGEKLGLKGPAAEVYAKQAVEIEMAKTAHADLIAKVEKDLHVRGLSLSRHQLEKEMKTFYDIARGQIEEMSLKDDTLKSGRRP